MESLKLCIECVSFVVDHKKKVGGMTIKQDICTDPRNDFPDPVHGGRTPFDFGWLRRDVAGVETCGLEGKWWKAKT